MTNVMLTCVGRRNYLARYFKEALNGRGLVFGTDMSSTAPGLMDCDQPIVVPSVYDQRYVEIITTLCETNDIDLLVPLNDLELPILAQAKPKFDRIGVTLAVSDIDVIDICFDKFGTYKWLRSQEIPTPDTYKSLESAKQAIKTDLLTFPCIVKPRWGSGSIGIFIVHDDSELSAAYNLTRSQLRTSMLATASQSDTEHCVIVQAMCNGQEFGCDVLNDFSGKTRHVIAKQKIAMRAGETDKAVVRKHDKLESFCARLGEKLGHVGNLDCDIFVDGDSFQVLELNPRFGGGYPFSHVAGAQYPETLLFWVDKDKGEYSSGEILYDQTYSKFDTLGRVGSSPNLCENVE